jgi:hypothetical protein
LNKKLGRIISSFLFPIKFAMKSKKNAIIIIFLFFPIAGGTAAYFALTKLNSEGPVMHEDPTTRFYVMNVSEIIAGKPALYNVTLENLEGFTVEYTLKVILEGREVHDRKIVVKNMETSQQTISLIPGLTGEYQKIEFLLYKNGELYRTRVLQILPAIDYGNISSINPPSLQNGDMESNSGWNFSGKKFSGSYTATEWRTGLRSYQVKTPTGVEKGAFGSISQEFSSADAGFASLSFEVRSDNASYYLQSVVNDNVVWENTSGKNWTKITVPVFLKRSNKVELNVIARNDTISNITVWWDNVGLENYSSGSTENPVEKITINKTMDTVIVNNYTVVKKGSSIIYTFKSGEKIELSVQGDNVSEGNAVYTTSGKGERIVFLGEMYEKVLVNRVNHLYPIILDITDKKLILNETLTMKNNNSITLESIGLAGINNMGMKLSLMDNNRRNELFLPENSSLVYRDNPYDYGTKYKKVQLSSGFINKSDAMLNITQYGSEKLISPGDIYGEFQIVNITQDSIVMKNILPLNLTNVTGKELPLMNGKIKIKVEK